MLQLLVELGQVFAYAAVCREPTRLSPSVLTHTHSLTFVSLSCLSLYLSIYLYLSLSVRLSLCLSVSLSLSLSLALSLFLSLSPSLSLVSLTQLSYVGTHCGAVSLSPLMVKQ